MLIAGPGACARFWMSAVGSYNQHRRTGPAICDRRTATRWPAQSSRQYGGGGFRAY
jgi:hypothetical protein